MTPQTIIVLAGVSLTPARIESGDRMRIARLKNEMGIQRVIPPGDGRTSLT